MQQPDDDQPVTARPGPVERRVWRNAVGVVAVAVLVSAPLAEGRFTLGLGLGGALALLNYRWLQSSLRDIFATGSSKTPPGTHLKFIVRWLVVAAVAWVANRTGYFDAVGIVAGLFSPAVAIMIEAGYTTIKALSHTGGD